MILSAWYEIFESDVKASDVHGMIEVVWFEHLIDDLLGGFHLLADLFSALSSWTCLGV